MAYISTLDDNQKKVMELIVRSLHSKGVSNSFIQGAVLAVVSKESNFVPRAEKGYSKTSNERIRAIFKKLANLSDDELNTLKADDVAFFNAIYGGTLGNAPDEGYKYRGRGLNGVTFKNVYKVMTAFTNVDIVENPDALLELDVAADVVVGYFINGFKDKQARLDLYNMTSIHDAQNIEDAVGAVYHANAGWGHTLEKLEKDPTGGRKKAFERAEEFLNYVQSLDLSTGGTAELSQVEIDTETDVVDPVAVDTNTTEVTEQGTTANTGTEQVPSGEIAASVGKGGENNENDVKIIQNLLNTRFNAGLKVDGDCGPVTITSIKNFQKEVMGVAYPDGKVDVGGKTWAALNKANA